ncbi:GtrA family protein [Aeromicrobium chenweiae]|uniref:GtrA family protein n=1 Tax=Aeromicrobium chenweiae TaxID=2079793 RepID=A0A2S0WK47_9ACTN|nr:GtrA family protein [Aeromicrobium chenweiae]AWB91719.1 GtrA family protein [Aeromicrobium chenweiae]TGN32560.1 GtrA family protein [Aeromicrobium chenweiae]
MSENAVPRRAVAAVVERRELRYLVVGGLNTAFCLAAFIVLDRLLGDAIHYMGTLVLAYAVGILTGFAAHRRFVFGVHGRLLGDFLRFTVVNLGGFAVNAALLPLLVEVVGIPPIPAQVLAIGCTVVVTYFGHALFSFKRD